MLHLRLTTPPELTAPVLDILSSDPAVSELAHLPGVSLRPPGDVVLASVAREAADGLIERLDALGLPRVGSIQIQPVKAWLSEAGLEAGRVAPGSGADTVVWADVTQQAYEDSEANYTFVSLFVLASLIAGVAIVLDSQILVIGAMVIGPEFGAIAALAVALVRRRYGLLRRAMSTLALGFTVGVLATTIAALVGRWLGWVTLADVSAERPATGFIYTPDKWSIIVAVVAAAAGVLSLTSARVGGLSGVFISVTTIPAVANIGVGLAFGLEDEVTGSLLQIVINVSCMALAGWLTLAFQYYVWHRLARRRHQLLSRLP